MGIDTAALLMISCTEKVQADFRLGLTCSHKSRSVHFRVGTVRCCCVDIGFQGSRTVSKTFVGILEIIIITKGFGCGVFSLVFATQEVSLCMFFWVISKLEKKKKHLAKHLAVGKVQRHGPLLGGHHTHRSARTVLISFSVRCRQLDQISPRWYFSEL